jgi:hypothetical protein
VRRIDCQPAATYDEDMIRPATIRLPFRAFLFGLWFAGVFSVATAGEAPCLDLGAGSGATGRMISTAVEILRGAGHDPAEYRVELRMEPAVRPDFPEWGGERVPSVVFLPRDSGRRYALRVHPAHPCELMWVWRPTRLTGWQRKTLSRARELLEPAGDDALGELVEVRVFETAGTIDVRWTGTGPDGSHERRVVLDKIETGG